MTQQSPDAGGLATRPPHVREWGRFVAAPCRTPEAPLAAGAERSPQFILYVRAKEFTLANVVREQAEKEARSLQTRQPLRQSSGFNDLQHPQDCPQTLKWRLTFQGGARGGMSRRQTRQCHPYQNGRQKVHRSHRQRRTTSGSSDSSACSPMKGTT